MVKIDYENMLFCESAKISLKAKNLATLKLHRLLEFLQKESQDIHILELACGVATFTQYMKQPGQKRRVVGVDISQHALSYAQKTAPLIDYVQADIGVLPFQANTFDIVCGFDILEHVDDIDLVFAEISRIIKPSGKIYFHIPCEGQPFSIWYILQKLKLGGRVKEIDAGHIQFFSFGDIQNHCSHYGFKVTSIKYSYHFIGQALDAIQWYAYALRKNMEIDSQFKSPDSKKTTNFFSFKGMLLRAILWIYRSGVTILEYLSYYESVFLQKIGFSMAFDISADKLQDNKK